MQYSEELNKIRKIVEQMKDHGLFDSSNTSIDKMNIYQGENHIATLKNINTSNKKSNKKKKKNNNTLICDNQIYDFFKRNPKLFDDYIKNYLKENLKIDYSSIEDTNRYKISVVLKDKDGNIINQSNKHLNLPKYF